MKTLILCLLPFLFISCASKSPYLWLTESQIREEIVKINLRVDEENKELLEMCQKEKLELIEKIPRVKDITVSIDGKKIYVRYEFGVGKVSEHNEFHYQYWIRPEGSFRDKRGTDSEVGFSYVLEKK